MKDDLKKKNSKCEFLKKMWTTLVLAILCIAIAYVAARELAVLRSFVALASISRERVRLACVDDSNGAYDAARRHVWLRAGCDVPDFWCWRKATSDSSLRELWSLGSWCHA